MTHYKKRSIRKKLSTTKRRSRKQRLWKMKGCAKYANMTGGCGCGAQVNNIMTGGGVCAGDILAYSPYDKINCVDNLAYTGKGGKRTPSESQFINDNLHLLLGGYGTCKGDNMPSGATYPSGAMGSPWTPNPPTWPGVAGVQGSPNHQAYNNYLYPQADRMLENTEAIPFSYGGKSNKSKNRTFRKHMRKHNKTNKSKKTNKHKNKKRQKGGLPTLGILTEIKNTWNTLRGNPQLPSPLPFNNQLENQNQLNIQ
jgi:hypothetical protein